MATTSSSAASPTSNTPSLQARLTIKDAFTRLQQSISQDNAKKFQQTTLSDVRQAAVDVERKMAARQNMRNMRRFETFLNGIEQYSKVLEVLCNGTPYLPWIWAPIKLMVQLSSEYLSSFEKLMDAYAQIAETIPRCDRLRTAFKHDGGFQEVIAMYYADILDFHRRAYKFFRARAWKRFFDSTWGRFDSRFKRILSNLAQHSELIDKEASAIDIAESKALRERLNDELSHREQESAILHRTSIMSWLDLNGIPNQEDELDRLLNLRHPGSCDWLLENNKIKEWATVGQSQQFIWIHGKPGAGKSVLCSNLISHLQQKGIPVLHFFCTYRSPKSRKAIDVLKSLATQAVPMNSDMVPYLVDTYVSKSLTSSLKDLRALLPQILSALPPGQIMLDGLDECEVEEQAKVVEDICTIIRNAGAGWKMLISSQDLPNISRSFSKLAHKARISLSEENRSISAAIESFIDQKLATLKNDAPYLCRQEDVAQSLKKEMIEKANGMFLWVRLVLGSMEETYSVKQLQDVILALPSDLTNLYDRILNDIRSRLGHHLFDKAVCMLRFILHACRPLKRAEVVDGFVLRDDAVDDMTKQPAEAVNICKPLIETGAGDTVVLVHFSLQQYLLSRPDMSSRQAHLDAAFACTRVITSGLNLIDPAQSENQKLVETGKGFFSLLAYGHTFWLEHLLSLVTVSGGLAEETSWNLSQQLDSFLARHDELSAVMTRRTADTETLPPVTDERLRFLDKSVELYTFVAKVTGFRSSSNRACRDGSAIEDVQYDPTLMTHMIQEFENLAKTLVSASSVPGLHPELLDAFKRSHGCSGFLCRSPGCAAVSGTFLTEMARNEHENFVHVRRLPCKDALCPYSSIGFRTIPDLRSHMRNFHAGARPSIVPPRVRRSGCRVEPALSVLQQSRPPRTHEQMQGHQVQDSASPGRPRSTGPQDIRYHSDGRVDASFPKPAQAPPPPQWLTQAVENLRGKYPDPAFEAIMQYAHIDIFTELQTDIQDYLPGTMPPPHIECQWLPRIRCDCTGGRWAAGPGRTLDDFEVHLNSRPHLEGVELRMAMSSGGAQLRNPNSMSMDKLNDVQRVQHERIPQQMQQQQPKLQQQQAVEIPHGIPEMTPSQMAAIAAASPQLQVNLPPQILQQLTQNQEVQKQQSALAQAQQQAQQQQLMAQHNTAMDGETLAHSKQQTAMAAQRQRISLLAQQISAQDIQRIRQQQGQKVANMTDDSLRQAIAQVRFQQQRNQDPTANLTRPAQQQQQDLSPGHWTDNMPFPSAVREQFGRHSVDIPNNIRLWSELKKWAALNPQLVSMDELNESQTEHYHAIMDGKTRASMDLDDQATKEPRTHSNSEGRPEAPLQKDPVDQWQYGMPPGLDVPTPREGSTYDDLGMLQFAIAQWAERENFRTRIIVQDLTHVGFHCEYFSRCCPWMVRAGTSQDTGVLTVHFIFDVHTCSQTGANGTTKYSSQWRVKQTARLLEEVSFHVTIDTQPRAIVELLVSRFQVVISDDLAVETKWKLLQERGEAMTYRSAYVAEQMHDIKVRNRMWRQTDPIMRGQGVETQTSESLLDNRDKDQDQRSRQEDASPDRASIPQDDFQAESPNNQIFSNDDPRSLT